MPLWVRGFVITDVAAVHEQYAACIRTAEKLALLEREVKRDLGAGKLLADLKASHTTLNTNLRLVAERTALQAVKGMKERLEGQLVRPSTGSVPPLKDLLEASPLPPIGSYQTGAVGVANVEFLNRALNPHSRGYGTYWRAQEYGTGQEGVPSQVGRILYGSFTEAGLTDPTRPLAEYAGGGGPHPIFLSRSAQGGGSTTSGGERTVGLGTIGKEVPAKHFIKFGADGAAVKWRQDIRAIQDRALSELRGIKLAGS